MNKMNEIAEASEQETPFHQLSQEEQHRITGQDRERFLSRA